MILSIHQPAYLPWLGYLERIAVSDIFIYLDNVQFEKNSFTNRNKIKTANGPIMLTIPVLKQGHTTSTIIDLKIDETRNWRSKHLRSIEQNYRKAQNFEKNFGPLKQLYDYKSQNFSDLCFKQLLFWVRKFDINTKILRASELDVKGSKSELVLNLCQHVDATTYLSGPLGRDYLDSESFSKIGIDLKFHNFFHPTYKQLHGEFASGMGAIDYWMNVCSLDIFHQERSIT